MHTVIFIHFLWYITHGNRLNSNINVSFLIDEGKNITLQVGNFIKFPNTTISYLFLFHNLHNNFMNTSPGNLLTFPPYTSGLSSKWQACQCTSQQLSLRPNGYWNYGEFINHRQWVHYTFSKIVAYIYITVKLVDHKHAKTMSG